MIIHEYVFMKASTLKIKDQEWKAARFLLTYVLTHTHGTAASMNIKHIYYNENEYIHLHINMYIYCIMILVMV